MVDGPGCLSHRHTLPVPTTFFRDEEVVIPHGTLEALARVPLEARAAHALAGRSVAEAETGALHAILMASLRARRRVRPSSVGTSARVKSGEFKGGHQREREPRPLWDKTHLPLGQTRKEQS